MTRSRQHRADVAQRRRRQQTQARARQTQLSQEAALAQAAWQRSRRRLVLAWILIGLGPAVFASHLISHTGLFEVFSPGLDDLVVGYPTAFLLVVSGLMLLPRSAA